MKFLDCHKYGQHILHLLDVNLRKFSERCYCEHYLVHDSNSICNYDVDIVSTPWKIALLVGIREHMSTHLISLVIMQVLIMDQSPSILLQYIYTHKKILLGIKQMSLFFGTLVTLKENLEAQTNY